VHEMYTNQIFLRREPRGTCCKDYGAPLRCEQVRQPGADHRIQRAKYRDKEKEVNKIVVNCLGLNGKLSTSERYISEQS
jgi:hypothetical protein